MKNKIISIIFIILLITSCRKSRDITGGGGNNGGNNGNSRLTKDNYEPPQTNTAAAKQFLVKFNEMKAKYPKGELMAYYRDSNGNVYDSGYKKYYFDKDANITNIYINGSGDKATNCQFWGMLPDDNQIACYYYEKNDRTFGVFNSLMYENELIKDKVHFFTGKGSAINEVLLKKSRDAVLKSIDGKDINTSTNTIADNDWKSKVADKILEEKEVENTYTFLDNGNIKVETKDKKTSYTFNFWGATNCYNYLFGIYYIKFNLQDIFGIIAPKEETYYYYGYRFEYVGYQSRFPELREHGQNYPYQLQFYKWYLENFDTKKPKENIDWSKMPTQKVQTIAFGNNQASILLMENKK